MNKYIQCQVVTDAMKKNKAGEGDQGQKGNNDVRERSQAVLGKTLS